MPETDSWAPPALASLLSSAGSNTGLTEKEGELCSQASPGALLPWGKVLTPQFPLIWSLPPCTLPASPPTSFLSAQTSLAPSHQASAVGGWSQGQAPSFLSPPLLEISPLLRGPSACVPLCVGLLRIPHELSLPAMSPGSTAFPPECQLLQGRLGFVPC